MQTIHLGAASLNQTPLDWAGNRRRITEAIAAARDAGVDILCLPELCVSGYGCEDMFFSSGVRQASLDSLLQIAPATGGMMVAVGLPLEFESRLYNTAAMFLDGLLVGFAAKQYLAGDGIHYEPRWFTPWPAGKVVSVTIDGVDYPLGDLLFDADGVRVGFEICRDAWVADRPGGRLARRGADVLLNPSASHFAFGKHRVRERLVLDGSRQFGVAYAFCNLLGNESGRSIYDGDTLIAATGELLAAGPRFSYRDWQLASAVVDLEAVREYRQKWFATDPASDGSASDGSTSGKLSSGKRASGKSSPDQSAPGGATVATHFCWPAKPNVPPNPRGPVTAVALDCCSQEEDFSRAVPLALFDYLRRSYSQGFVVSLSGGADSAAVAVMVHLMAKQAIAELGAEAFCQRLAHLRSLADGTDCSQASDATGHLLTCVYQATRNSSATTRNAAHTIATALGGEFLEWSVDEMVDAYVSTVSASIGRQLTWESDDITLQNIQARARGPAVWMIANLRGALLLATSNRSEAAVGYTTMDGDTCGGLSPIAGIDKAFLRQWLRWMETSGPEGVGPIPELAVINQQQPTAELRPLSAEQTDEGDLMPYEVLDAIEQLAIRDKRPPVDCWRAVQQQFADNSPQQLGEWVERFFTLWSRNQWKRERYAPSFHLDDENLDPKTWCRFPILSSGFVEELAALRKELAAC